jgi:hypothetical protein
MRDSGQIWVSRGENMGLRTNIPAFWQEYAEEEHKEYSARAYPAVCDIGSGFVEVWLVCLCTDKMLAIGSRRAMGLRITLENRDVCAVTAEKGVWSGSTESILDIEWRNTPEKKVRISQYVGWTA